MATKIRLARAGAKKRPFYQIVVADERSRRDGSFIENVGTYDPTKNPAVVKLKTERAAEWLGKGAQPTDTVKNLLSRKGVWLKWSLKKKKADEATIAAEFEKWQMMQGLKLQKENERNARRNAAKKKKKAVAQEAPAAPAQPEAAAPAAPAQA